MSYATQVASYREMEILSASPERLVVLLFDHLVVQLHRVKLAVDANDVVARTNSIRKSRGIVSELLSTLDFDKGGPISHDLATLYRYILGEMAEIGTQRNARHVEKLIGIVETLREGFTGAASSAVPMKRQA